MLPGGGSGFEHVAHAAYRDDIKPDDDEGSNAESSRFVTG
jgi:hypothetical protein